jgi:hypothetical protein
MPLVISNSSTLIHLAAIGRLALLKEFYGKVTIPTAVWREVVEEGEAEVIALAISRRAGLVLLDETEARSVAELYGLRKTGAVGVLMRAKQVGEVRSLRAELEKLRDQAGFWIDEGLYRRALRAVGEES